MSYLLSPAGTRPALLRPPVPPAPRRVGRFAETPWARGTRAVFGVLCTVAPAVAARIGYALLAKPPRSAENRWQAALREKARVWQLECGVHRLAVYEWGAGPAVLLVHGWGSRETHLGKMAGPLVKAGFRVVAFDAPAHGASPGRSTDLVEFASAVAAVARHVGPLRCVVAHSFGASMALYAQRDWGFESERFVLVSSFDHCNWFTEAFGDHVGLSPTVLEQVRQMLVERYGGQLSWARMSVADMLRQSEAPALIVHDESDEEIPFQHALSLVHTTPRAQLLATRGYGHQRMLRRNDVITRIVQFVAQPESCTP